MSALDATVPYPWPYDSDVTPGFDPARLALLITGAQARWSDLPDAPRVLSDLADLVGSLRPLGVLVAMVRHAHPAKAAPGPSKDLPDYGSVDWDLALPSACADVVVDAPGYDGFRSGWLDPELHVAGRDRLLLAGLAYETTVDTTLRSANDRGYECLTLTDLVVHLDPAAGVRALNSITMSGGIFGAIGTSTAVRAALGVPLERRFPQSHPREQ